jgi:4'-phosphopantetheinyl transferase
MTGVSDGDQSALHSPAEAAPAVGVFLCAPASQTAADLEVAIAAMSGEERARAARFVFPRDRLSYQVAHGLLRLVLARQTGVAARDLAFSSSALGRPELQPGGEGPGRVRFNLSHTRDLVGCAVTRDAEIGFDLERMMAPAPIDTAGRYFSPAERAWLSGQVADRQPEAFYELWTLKEAYLKARGLGLSLPLESFSIVPAAAPGTPPSLAAPPGDGGPWSLQSWRFADHRCALALGASTMPPLAVQADLHLLDLHRAALSGARR